jgi:protein SCO1/2
MQRPLLIAANLLLAGILVWLLWHWDPIADQPHPLQTLALGETPTGGDFRLESAAGPLDLANLRGQVVLIHFGYTWCPDICPTNLAFIASAIRTLSLEEQERVEVLFVSVDPERDDAARLAQYTGYFHPRFRGLTGSPEQIAEVARLYGAAYRRGEETGSSLGYLVDHTSFTYVVDPQGRLARTLDHATPPERIAATIRSLLVGG